MKKLIAVLALAAMATTTTAGTLVYTPEVAPVIIEESGPMGSGSGAWLIPLIVIALLALAMSNSGNGAQPNNPQNGPTNGPLNGILNGPSI
jgi:hypothetical protein